jgi:hypothetical protein
VDIKVPPCVLSFSGRDRVLKRVGFFDTAGAIVEEYLREPIALKPFATVEIFVPVNDVRGGTGANFVVNWSATDSIAEPAAAALMLGGVGGVGYSFIKSRTYDTT